ncbi:MAG: diguanylate cyclase, partial [Clostridia bacterium]|nr:diguanylate cyclase [Clostridia bacterium]
MIGYSWFSTIALFCYVFLLATFLSSKKTSKVIYAFISLLVVMILWSGGSLAMRMQFWPSVNFWHHVSVLGMTLLIAGYYTFITAFLEIK